MARPLEPEIKAMRTIKRAMESLTASEAMAVRAWMRIEPPPEPLWTPGQITPMNESPKIVTIREERFRMALETIAAGDLQIGVPQRVAELALEDTT